MAARALERRFTVANNWTNEKDFNNNPFLSYLKISFYHANHRVAVFAALGYFDDIFGRPKSFEHI